MAEFSIKGIPVSDIGILADAVPGIVGAIAAGSSALDIVKVLEPTALGAIESIANILFPGAGTAIEIVAFIIENSKPMTASDEQRYWDKAAGQGF